MPKKIIDAMNYFVFVPNASSPESILTYFRSQKNILGKHERPRYHGDFLNPEQDEGAVNDALPKKDKFIFTLSSFLKTVPPIPDEFYIFEECNDIIFISPANVDVFINAVECRRPFAVFPNQYVFWNTIWKLSDKEMFLTEDQLRLILLEQVDKERKYFEKLKRVYDRGDIDQPKYTRAVIPEDVRVFVWRRDQGKCVACGGQYNLEYDHIIPVSKGGSNTARNLQILCETCNRKKSDSI